MTILYGLVEQKQNVPVPLRGVDVIVTVHGFVANVEASLQYANSSETDTLEVVYVFPVDDNSAVYKLEAHIDGKHIAAEVQEKEQARETYNEAVASGHSAILMEEHDASGDIFRCKLGNLPPTSKADIKFSFVTELSLETDGSLKFVLPTVLNPRYNPSPEDGGTKEDMRFSNRCHYNLTFKGSVRCKQGISRVWSEKDDFKSNLQTGEFELAGPPRLDHDITFQVLYENCHKPQTTIEKGIQGTKGLMTKDLLMLSFYPDLSSSPTSGPAEFIFVIDRSGSMQGQSIQSAKEAMLFFLKSLPVDCFFNIISFGSSYSALFPEGSKRYDEGTLNQAMRLQASLEADMGGTEILRPLEFVFRKKAQPGYPRQIFLLTDGGVSNAKEVVSLVKRNSYDSRVFTVGIGDGVSTSLVRNVAKAGGGKAEFVTGKDKLQQKVIMLLKAATQPAATEISLDLDLPPGLSIDLMLPKDMPVIFSGQRCTIYVFLGGSAEATSTGKGKALLSGKIAGSSFQHELEFDLAEDAQVTTGQFVHRMAMKGLIKDLEIEESDSNGEKKRDIILASTASNLISKYTSFVGVDKEKNEKITDAITYHVAPPPRPYLMGGMVSMRLCAMPIRKSLCSGSRRRSKKCSDLPPPPPPGGVMASAQPPRSLPQSSSNHDERTTSQPPPPPPARGYSGSAQLPPPPLPSCSQPTAARIPAVNHSYSVPSSMGQKSFSSSAGEMVMQQEFDGSWNLSKGLTSIVNIPEDVLRKGTTIKDMKVLATCVAVCWLTLKCPEERSVWEMVVNKANQWLLRMVRDQTEMDKLLQEVRESFFKD